MSVVGEAGGALLFYGPTVVVWAAVLYRTRALIRRPRDPGLRALWLTLLLAASAMTVLAPPMYTRLNELTGVRNLSRLLANILGLMALYEVQKYLSHLLHPERGSRRKVDCQRWFLIASIVLMALLFILAPVHSRESSALIRDFGTEPFVLEYRLIFLGWFGLGMYNVVRFSWRYANITRKPATLLGIRMVTFGGVFGLAYALHEAVYAVATRFGVNYPLLDPLLVTRTLTALIIVPIVIGSTIPSWGPRVGVPALYAWVTQYRAHRHLRALWLDLCRACPEIAFRPHGSNTHRGWLAGLPTGRGLASRLYGLVVEIHDGCLSLAPYVDPKVTERAHRISGAMGLTYNDAELEAASLATAVYAKSVGKPKGRHTRILSQVGGTGLVDEVSYLEDVAHLEEVARCYKKSRLVRAVMADVRREMG